VKQIKITDLDHIVLKESIINPELELET